MNYFKFTAMNGLSKNELMEVEGGLSFWGTVGAGILVGGAIYLMYNWDDFKAGLLGEI
mgnify:FL=1